MRYKNQNMNGIPLELKSRILAESMLEGAVIASVAKKYKISKGTIYNWMKQNMPTTNADKQFVELSVMDEEAYTEPEIVSSSTLKSVSLIWNDLNASLG